jgi:hypothetical protein
MPFLITGGSGIHPENHFKKSGEDRTFRPSVDPRRSPMHKNLNLT